MFDSFADAVQAADDGWAVLAIAIIGLYVLLWRFGGQMLALARDTNDKANSTHEKTDKITSAIITNHASKNIGDAIDKITGAIHDLRADVTEIKDRQAQVKIDLELLKAKDK